MTPTLDVAALLRRLHESGVEHVLIGGLAVMATPSAWSCVAHGVIRTTQDVDICPDPDTENLERLASLLGALGVAQLGVDDEGFEPQEMPFDPTRAEDLAQGGNFRLQTPLGVLGVMQRVPGVDADQAYALLASDSIQATAFGVPLRVCSLDALRRMKRAAGRQRDLQDLTDLEAAHPQDAP